MSKEHPLEYLDSPESVSRLTDEISREPVIAIDTEGASFHRFVDRIYLLQLSVQDRSAIIDPLPMKEPPGLGALLEDPAIEIIFHDADYDLRLLHQDYGWRVRNIFDTRIAAQLLGLKAFGLGALLERYFGVRLDKKHQRADWSMRPLTQDMLDYAAYDTRYLIDLRTRMSDELKAKRRMGWAQEEFARLEGTQWTVDDSGNAFLRMKGARDLTRPQLAVLRELVRWRDEVARELDRATFRVVGNEVLFALSKNMPATKDALAETRGMPRGILERRGDELLEAIARGAGIAPDQHPRFPRGARYERDPELEPRVSRLRSVRDAAAERLELDPGVLCSRDRLEAIARARPTTIAELSAIPDLRRWQVAEMGEDFLAALREGAGGGTPPATPRSGGSRSRQQRAPTSRGGSDESPYAPE